MKNHYFITTKKFGIIVYCNLEHPLSTSIGRYYRGRKIMCDMYRYGIYYNNNLPFAILFSGII